MIINNSDFTIRGYLDKQIIDLNNKVIKFVINTNEVTKIELLLWKDVRNTDSFELIKKHLGTKVRLEFGGKIGVSTYEKDGETKYYTDLFVNKVTLIGNGESNEMPEWTLE